MQQGEQPSSITVTLDDNYPPYIFRDSAGNLQGILKDVWDLWARRTGIQVRFEAKDWGRALRQMAAGRADVIDSIFHTDARAPLYDFSKPYAAIPVPIFFDSKITGISDAQSLRGFTVGVKDGDACADWLTARGITSLKKYPSYEVLVNAAASEDVRVFCMDAPPALYFLYKNNIASRFRFTEPLYTGQLHWAVKKGDAALYSVIAAGFAQITDSERKQIEDRWQGQSLAPEEFVRNTTYLLLAAAVITAALFLWNWTLRRKVISRTVDLTSTLGALNASQKHFELLVSTTPVGVFETDAKGACVFVNERWLEITSITRDQAIGEGWVRALHPECREAVAAEWLAAVRQARPFYLEYRFQRPDGGATWVLGQASAIRNAEGDITGYIGCVTDINERKTAESQIEFLAHHDALTKLPNRVLARDRIQLAMSYAERSGLMVALLFLDLDHFKTINDSLGHAVGDELLKAVAERLRACLRDTDTISRQGGDEFLIVLTGVINADFIAEIAAKIVHQSSQPFTVEGQELELSLSAGIAVYPDDGADFDTLLRKADTAMYHAKDAGRNTYRFFTEQMNLDAIEHLAVRNSLRRALEYGDFILHYQPQVDLATGRVVGVEALIRLNHPELGLVSPARFIPVAEDSGLIVPIGEWVLHEACRQAAAWHKAGFRGLVVAVNLSAVQFKRSDLEKTVIAALTKSGLAPACLELELTESILIGDTEKVLETVRRIKTIGVKLSIDDFGTGYSSLSYLKRFPLDKLKIDQSFIRDMTEDSDDAAIVRAIIQMAQSLGLRTIAEGVERAEMVDRLRIYQCDEAQGYFFARPMPADEFSRYLTVTTREKSLVPPAL